MCIRYIIDRIINIINGLEWEFLGALPSLYWLCLVARRKSINKRRTWPWSCLAAAYKAYDISAEVGPKVVAPQLLKRNNRQ